MDYRHINSFKSTKTAKLVCNDYENTHTNVLRKRLRPFVGLKLKMGVPV